jgi:hypothetical protein
VIEELKIVATIMALTVPFFVGTVWAIVNALQKDFGSTGRKALWAMVAAVPFIGFVIYFIFGSKKGRKPS